MNHSPTEAALPWLREGLRILVEDGADVLTIDELCARLGRTKGAFYHHFSGRRGYIEALMAFWRQEKTLDLIERSRSEAEPEARIRRLTRLVLDAETARLEVAIRGWADREPAAAAALREVDRDRQAFLVELVDGIAGAGPRNRDVARLIYAVHVGAQYLSPPVGRDEMGRLYDQLAILIRSAS